eukprot:503628_1
MLNYLVIYNIIYLNYIVLIWTILVMLLFTIVSYIQTGWVLYGIKRKHERAEKLVKTINEEWESNISLYTVYRNRVQSVSSFYYHKIKNIKIKQYTPHISTYPCKNGKIYGIFS